MKNCTIVVTDEVNCHIRNLDLDVRRALVKAFKYDVPYARYLPSVRLGRWDGKVAYFQLGGSTYVNLLPQIIPILEKFNYIVELNDSREYNTQFDFEVVTENSFSHFNWGDKHPLEGTPIVLRDYQVQSINRFLTTPQCLQEIATGAGKSIMTAAMSQRCEVHGRTIIIVPSKSLVTQTEKDYRALKLDVGVYFGGRKEFGHTHTICTWQSLNVLLKNTKNDIADITIDEFLKDVICVIVDECHSAKATALKTLLTGVMSMVPIRWGLTGTVPKEMFESQALHVSVGPIINNLAASELQNIGVLANCHVNIVQLVDHVEHRDYQSELKYLLEDADRLDAIARLIQKVGATGNTLVLIDRVAAGTFLVEKLNGAVFLSGITKAEDRQIEYDDIAVSDEKILVCTYGIAAIGINIPRIFNLVLIEPGKSFVRVIQSIGRGLRRAADKEAVMIWDITSTCKFAKRHLTKRKSFYKEAKYEFSHEKLEWK